MTSTEVPTDTADHDHEGLDEQDTRESDLGSSSTKKDLPKTGKDYVPEYSGETPMREYQRRVRLFEASTSIDASYRAQKLMERLSGQAWLATESLDLDYIKHPEGVKRLLQHLWQELEPLEYLRTFTTLAEFYKGFKRTPGMEYITYDMEFRAHLKRLEEIGAKVEGLTQAYWFIEKAGLSSELRKQVVAAAGGEYDYHKLRRALLAIVPKVNKEEDGGNHTRFSPGNRQWKPRSNHNNTRQVHATLDDTVDDPEENPVEEAEAVGDSAALEGELEVLLTQAARKRAQIEKSRGFAKQESATEREQRIREMKSRMPCSACKLMERLCLDIGMETARALIIKTGPKIRMSWRSLLSSCRIPTAITRRSSARARMTSSSPPRRTPTRVTVTARSSMRSGSVR